MDLWYKRLSPYHDSATFHKLINFSAVVYINAALSSPSFTYSKLSWISLTKTPLKHSCPSSGYLQTIDASHNDLKEWMIETGFKLIIPYMTVLGIMHLDINDRNFNSVMLHVIVTYKWIASCYLPLSHTSELRNATCHCHIKVNYVMLPSIVTYKWIASCYLPLSHKSELRHATCHCHIKVNCVILPAIVT